MPDEVKIRTLLDDLQTLVGGDAITRLANKRGVGGQSLESKRKALAQSYAGNHEVFLADLRKSDLVALLEDPTEIDGDDYYLPDASSYEKEDLERIAYAAFAEEGVPEEFERVDGEGDDDDDDDTDESENDYDDDGDADADDDDDEAAYMDDDYDEVDDDDASDGDAERFEAEFALDSNPVSPYAYQQRALRDVWASLVPGARSLLHVATGGGKTLIANNLVAWFLIERKKRVLWITKDWRLLRQAAGDLSRRFGLRGKLFRMGGAGRALRFLDDAAGPVQYTTIQTLARRIKSKKPFSGVGLVIWDECHWGEHGKSGRLILKALGDIPLVGLTATPRQAESSAFTSVHSKTFDELVREGYLAKPLPREVPTNLYVDLPLDATGGDFRKSSLQELADNDERNALIVDHYHKNASLYGKTIVFTCGKDHANELARMFGRRGYAARPIHSGNEEAENRAHLESFRSNRINIVTNVEMLTHGVDVPDAQTVFLTRPTLSDILYAQMIGRASRRDEGKTYFHIVDFTDNHKEFGGYLCTAKKFFAGAGGASTTPEGESPPGTSSSSAASALHRFNPQGMPTWIADSDVYPEQARGLWYREGQTFGFEIEVTRSRVDIEALHHSKEWLHVAQALRNALSRDLPNRVSPRVYEDHQGVNGDKSHDVWNVEFDGSVGWEVTSRILKNQYGYVEVIQAAHAIEQVAKVHQLKVNSRTGLHVHLGWTYQRPDELRRFIRLVRLFEPALATIVPASRIASYSGNKYHVGKPNEYCSPISTVIRKCDLQGSESEFLRAVQLRLADHDSRYTTVNLRPLITGHGTGTVEIRMHSGTMEAKKMLVWLSLWQQILWAAGTNVDVPDVNDCTFIEPNGDIVALARAYLPSAGQAQQRHFLEMLKERRADIVKTLWEGRTELKRWLGYAQKW
jgi:superfamily II DNA or RNA helicase